MPEKKRYALNIYLLSLPADVKVDGSTSWHSKVLRNPSDVRGSTFPVLDLPGAMLYTYQYPSRPPNWTKYFPGKVQEKLKNSSTGGVLLLSVDKQAVAISFGLGRHLLAPQAS